MKLWAGGTTDFSAPLTSSPRDGFRETVDRVRLLRRNSSSWVGVSLRPVNFGGRWSPVSVTAGPPDTPRGGLAPELLAEAKAKLPHGQWLPWLE